MKQAMDSHSLNKHRLKRYFDVYVPVYRCNLQCSYCYISQLHPDSLEIKPLGFSIQHIRKSLSRDRLGGTCLLSLCGGGETLMAPYIVDLTRELLEEGHYVMLVTNGLPTKRIRELTENIPAELQKHLILKISFHFMELKSNGLLEKYFGNIRLVERSNISFTVELTPSDDQIPYIEEIKQVCINNLGTLCHITVAREESKSGIPILSALPREEYIKVWGQFDSPLFDFKMKIFGEPRKEFCYNGLYGGTINLANGTFSQCYGSRPVEIFDNPAMPIYFCPIGKCEKAHCYNGHSWLSLGMIPDLVTPSYLEMRDRVTADGRHWVGEEMRRFLSQKLSENNDLLSPQAKQQALRQNRLENLIYSFRRLIGKKWSVLTKKLRNCVRF